MCSLKKVNNKERDQLEKAKNYAFLLLKFRPRSEKEIYSRLKKKKFPEGIIQETLLFLKARDFLNDIKFSRAWIESGLKKPLGLRRIREELRLKGIAQEIIDSQLGEIKAKYPEVDIVRKIAQEKKAKTKGLNPYKAKSRIYAYLLRRGFSPDIVIDVINQLCTPPFLKDWGVNNKGRAGCNKQIS